jgi:alkyl sulfatase BDS1-like metallo-beta-lactamase superfamily hydrolase
VLDLPAPKALSPDTVRATPLDMFFDLLAVRLIGPRAAGKTIVLNTHFTDIDERYVLTVENGVLNHARGKHADHADASLTTTRATLDQIALGEATAAEKLAAGEATIEGDPTKFVEFLSLLDTFEFWFNIVTP